MILLLKRETLTTFSNRNDNPVERCNGHTTLNQNGYIHYSSLQ